MIMLGGPAVAPTPKEDIFAIAKSLIKATSGVDVGETDVRHIWRFGKNAGNIGVDFVHSSSFAGVKAQILR